MQDTEQLVLVGKKGTWGVKLKSPFKVQVSHFSLIGILEVLEGSCVSLFRAQGSHTFVRHIDLLQHQIHGHRHICSLDIARH